MNENQESRGSREQGHEEIARSSQTPDSRNSRTRARRRWRRFLLRHVPLTVGGLAVFLALALLQIYFYASSAGFENRVRERLAQSLSNLTGGRVEIAAFHWRLLHLEAEADGIVIHGREAADESPYAKIDHLRLKLSVLSWLTPRTRLSDLEVRRPALHLIVYPDGSTNQPQPRRKRKPGKPDIDRLFDLQAGRVAFEDGMFDYDNRAARFDYQDRRMPLDFAADDVSLQMSYVPAAGAAAESYRIQAAATDVNLARGARRKAEEPVHGHMQATLDLMRNQAALEQLRVSARSEDGKERVLEVNGRLEDFMRPRWQAKIDGELDMRLIEPVTGYPLAPEGLARVALAANGTGGGFDINGRVHVDNGAYVGPGVTARNVTLDARLHADAGRLLIDNVVARLRQGGEIDGTVDLANWLPPSASEPRLLPAAARVARRTRPGSPTDGPATVTAADDTIPVDGKVKALFKNVALDTILGIVSEPPFQRLGIDALLNGPAEATWNKGDNSTVVVSSNLLLSPSGHAVSGDGSSPRAEAPAHGAVDATYTQRDGSVDVRMLQLRLPGSTLEASGRLGAYPMTSGTALAVNFHSGKLEEFDTVLRGLGLERPGRTGAEALPARLTGQADFTGTWAGSLLRPRIAGTVHATQLALEMPPAANDRTGKPQFVSFDSAEAAGSYSDTRIAIEHATFARATERLTLSGTLDATSGPVGASAIPAPRQNANIGTGHGSPAGTDPRFDRDSVLHAKVQAAKVGIDDLQPFFSAKLPVTGVLDAQLELNGPLAEPGGNGWLELAGGTMFGQAIDKVRAQGSLANQLLKLSTVKVIMASGSLTGAGSYDFAARRFQAKAQGTDIELARTAWLQRNGISTAGKLAISASGSGTIEDPRFDGHATVSGLVVNGEPLGGMEAVAHTADRTLHYDVTTQLAGAELNLHGQTELHDSHATTNRLEFSKFDVGALVKMTHLQALTGESAMNGTVTLTGPLAKPEQLRGEARLEQLEMTVAGVRLKGEGGLHATLADGRIHMDPVHVTGENTDVHAFATLALTGERRLDLAASGTINLKLAETLDPDLTASGTTTFEVEAHGTVQNPGLRGRIDVQNGSLSLEDVPNGLSQLRGTLQFNQNRLEVRNLTAMSGGGLLSVGGTIAYQHGLYADLSVTGKGVRIRYPQNVSSLADADLRLQGSQTNLLLSGKLLITRFATSPDLDLASLMTQANAKVETVALPSAPSNHVRLDIRLVSSPQLNFQNAFAKLAGNVDLRVRGTLASPSVLGRVSITEGSAVIAGTRYELQRGDVTLTNPVRIEPVIDLAATARVEDYDITLGLHGTLAKLAVSYRSDPPLPESDVVSLLALGHTENQERLYTRQQEQEFANPATDALLGGALNATVSSRVQKLFGAGSVKVDPDYLGAFGNSTSRITVQEQLGRNLTLTYATDVNTTSQQLLQAEVAINRHVSLVVARDESGVFSMVVKATRRYR